MEGNSIQDSFKTIDKTTWIVEKWVDIKLPLFHNYTVDLYKISLFLGCTPAKYNGKKGVTYAVSNEYKQVY